MEAIMDSNYIDCLKLILRIQFSNDLFFLKRRWGLYVILVNPFGFYITQRQRRYLKEIIEASKKSRCLFSQIVENPLNPFSVREKEMLEYFDFKPYQTFTHILFLEDTFEETIKRASKRRRWEMRKYANSQWRRALLVKAGWNIELLHDFYELYNREAINRWKLKKVPYDKQLLECFLRDRLIKIFSIYEKNTGKLTASAIFMEDTNSAFYWIGITNIELNKKISYEVKIYPTSILWAFIIDQYIAEKKKYINLGSSEGLPKVAKFKETLGGIKRYYSIWKFQRLTCLEFKKHGLWFI